MTCSDFQPIIDAYVDGALSPAEMARAAQHLAGCRSCERIVTHCQQAGALLKTAVTDMVAAVDVSGLWKSVEFALEGEGKLVRSSRLERLLSTLRPSFRIEGRRGWARAGAWGVAAVAAAAILFVLSTPAPRRGQLASSAHGGRLAAALVRVDSMEAARGYAVSTWIRPRTRTRVIWVSEGGGFSASTVGYER